MVSISPSERSKNLSDKKEEKYSSKNINIDRFLSSLFSRGGYHIAFQASSPYDPLDLPQEHFSRLPWHVIRYWFLCLAMFGKC